MKRKNKWSLRERAQKSLVYSWWIPVVKFTHARYFFYILNRVFLYGLNAMYSFFLTRTAFDKKHQPMLWSHFLTKFHNNMIEHNMNNYLLCTLFFRQNWQNFNQKVLFRAFCKKIKTLYKQLFLTPFLDKTINCFSQQFWEPPNQHILHRHGTTQGMIWKIKQKLEK